MRAEPAIIAAHMRELIGTEAWGCYQDLLANLVSEDTEALIAGTNTDQKPDFTRGRIVALRQALTLPNEWIEWRKKLECLSQPRIPS